MKNRRLALAAKSVQEGKKEEPQVRLIELKRKNKVRKCVVAALWLQWGFGLSDRELKQQHLENRLPSAVRPSLKTGVLYGRTGEGPEPVILRATE